MNASSLVVALALVLAQRVVAAETEVRMSEVPQPVMDAVAAAYAGLPAKELAREVEDGKEFFEVSLSDNGKTVDVSVWPDGKIFKEEREVAESDVPAPVRQGLSASRYGKAKVLIRERVQELPAVKPPVFEFLVEQQDGERHEVVLDSTGKLSQEEAKGKPKAGEKDAD